MSSRLAHEQIAGGRDRDDVREQVAYRQNGGESLEDRDEPPVLLSGVLEVDDIVVEEVFAGVGRHREELPAGRVHEHRAQPADF